jgi:hypothetical protein
MWSGEGRSVARFAADELADEFAGVVGDVELQLEDEVDDEGEPACLFGGALLDHDGRNAARLERLQEGCGVATGRAGALVAFREQHTVDHDSDDRWAVRGLVAVNAEHLPQGVEEAGPRGGLAFKVLLVRAGGEGDVLDHDAALAGLTAGGPGEDLPGRDAEHGCLGVDLDGGRLGVEHEQDAFAGAGDRVGEGQGEGGLAGAGLAADQDRCGGSAFRVGLGDQREAWGREDELELADIQVFKSLELHGLDSMLGGRRSAPHRRRCESGLCGSEIELGELVRPGGLRGGVRAGRGARRRRTRSCCV